MAHQAYSVTLYGDAFKLRKEGTASGMNLNKKDKLSAQHKLGYKEYLVRLRLGSVIHCCGAHHSTRPILLCGNVEGEQTKRSKL